MSFLINDCVLMEQRYVIRYCCRKGLTPAETIEEMQKIYKKMCYDDNFILKLHKRYKEKSKQEGSSSAYIVDIPTVKVAQARTLVSENKKLTLKQISERLDLSLTLTFTIMTDHLGMTMVGHEWVRFDDHKNSTPLFYCDENTQM